MTLGITAPGTTILGITIPGTGGLIITTTTIITAAITIITGTGMPGIITVTTMAGIIWTALTA